MTDGLGAGSSPLATEKPPIASIWYRLVAFLIDGIILAAPAYAFGFTFFRWSESLGQGGCLVGFIVALLYFGLLDSKIGNGQTLGKRLLELRVVDRDGAALSPGRAGLRFLIFGVPYFLNGVWIDVDLLHPSLSRELLGAMLMWGVFGVLVAIVYLFIFNRRTRQSLPDLVVGSFVVHTTEPTRQINLSTPRLHIALVSSWLVLTLIALVVSVFVQQPTQIESLRPMAELRNSLRTRLSLSQVSVAARTTYFVGTGGNKSVVSYLLIDASGRGRSRSADHALQQSIARIVLDLQPDLLGKTYLSISISHGFDFGIASWTVRYQSQFSATDWQKKLEQAASSQGKT